MHPNVIPACRFQRAAILRSVHCTDGRYARSDREVQTGLVYWELRTALLEVSFKRQRVVAWIKRASGGRNFGYADQLQIIPRVKFSRGGTFIQPSFLL